MWRRARRLYTFKDRPGLCPETRANRRPSCTRTLGTTRPSRRRITWETFSSLRDDNPNQTPVVKAQNMMAMRRVAPMVVAAGVFDGHRVTVMQKVQDAVTLEAKYPENTDEAKRKWRHVFRSMSSRLRGAGICHHDLHSRNVVYGWLTNKTKYRYYLVDFDNSFFLAGEETECNDRAHDENDENVAEHRL